MYLASAMAITVGYHRLVAHSAFECRPWFKVALLVAGSAAWQGSALSWTSDHLRHHAHTDQDSDPYNIRRGFWYAHVGWLFTNPNESDDLPAHLAEDPLLAWQDRWYFPLAIATGFVLPWAICGVGGLLLAGVVRLVAVHHGTWFVNSWAHLGRRRPWNPAVSAADSWLVALVTFGEGWHNYHHAFPGDYRAGVERTQFDPSKWLIWSLSKLGIAWNLQRVGFSTRWRRSVHSLLSWEGDSSEKRARVRELQLRLHRQMVRSRAKALKTLSRVGDLPLPANLNAAAIARTLESRGRELGEKLGRRARRRLDNLSRLSERLATLESLSNMLADWQPLPAAA
jgi:stearoyl-CoA desaturase (delta-9 desaturase)